MKGKVKGLKFRVLLLLGMLSIGLIGNADASHVFAASNDDTPFVVNEHWLEPVDIYDYDANNLARRGAVLPAQYDARQNNWVTSVKDQGNYETCWAFASIAAIESNLLKNGKATIDIDLSENQFAYFFYNRQTDKLKYTAGDYNNNLIGNYLTGGGTLQGSGIALATWAGVTTEARSPYPTVPSPSLCYAADYSVKNVYLYSYDIKNLSRSVSTIKQAVLDHGAVACGINMLKEYYNSNNYSYYNPKTGGNHALTIIGWDDSYSKENFNSTPPVDGAWIVKNSYGASFGDKGYNYVSYADASIAEFIAFEAVTAQEQYDNNYQHDGTANPGYAYNAAEWTANVFKANAAGGYNEELKAVGVFLVETNVSYEVQVYTGLTKASKPTSGTKAFSSTVKGTLADAGYQTIPLPKPVSLEAGENFAILVKLTTPRGTRAYVGVDMSYRNNWISFIAKTGKNQSFAQVGSKWHDFGAEGANFRIKAYTDNTATKPKFKLNQSNVGVSKGGSEKLSLNMAANMHRKVTWTSANKKVATVNTKGKVTGKAYGTTTINATFVSKSKTKTLKCKVTVGPSKLKKFKVSAKKNKLTVKWKKASAADGYEIYYATASGGKYKKLATVSNKNKTSYSKKMKGKTYYIKVRPYKMNGKKKLYGSYTQEKQVIIQ